MRSDIHTYHVEKNEFLDLVVLGRQHVAYNGDEETREVFAVQHGADGVLHAFLPDAHLVRFLQVGGREDVGKRKEGGGGRGGEGHVAERDDERSERGLFPFFFSAQGVGWHGYETSRSYQHLLQIGHGGGAIKLHQHGALGLRDGGRHGVWSD